ncbi:MAG: polyhydroxyalkanoate synthesis repressor PhaR [Brevundimonas sp.]
MADSSSDGARPKGADSVIIKKYANRRLYNTATSAYVTLDDLARMVRDGVDFQVFDAKTNEELTRQVLTQIIFEEETRGQALLPVQFLRQLIGFYGGQMQGVLPSYLEMSLDAFARQQEQFQSQMTRALAAAPGGAMLEEAAKRNAAMFQEAMRMFSPFAYGKAAESKPTEAAAASGGDQTLAEMRRQMDEMRAQLDKLSQDKAR